MVVSTTLCMVGGVKTKTMAAGGHGVGSFGADGPVINGL